MTHIAQTGRTRTAPDMFAPIAFMRREMDRLFDQAGANFWNGNGAGANGLTPDMDIAETDKDIQIVADLPGVDVKDVDVSLANGVLTIRGEKRSERDEKKADFHLQERSFGAFTRRISVPEGCDPNQVKAEFANGVLKVTVPKPAEAQAAAAKIKITKA